MQRQIPDDVLDVLQQHATCDGASLQLTGQLDRRLYLATNKVLESLGGTWNRKAKAHIFNEDASPLIADAITTGMYFSLDALKKAYQAFNTPYALAEQLVDTLDIESGDRVLEPEAGTGVIAREMRARGANVTCVEIQVDLANALEAAGFTAWPADFLEWHPVGDPEFDKIGMNPPFTRGQDIKHVCKAFSQHLRPGGTLTSIMSSGWTYRSDKQATVFREWLEKRDHTVTEIPEKTFSDSGTNIRTLMVTIQKAGG